MGTDPNAYPTRPPPGLQSQSALIIERAPLPIVEVQGAAHTVSHVNSAFCRLVGKSRAKLVGTPFATIVPGGDKCLPVLNQVYATGEAATLAHEVEAETNPTHWLYAMWPALDANDQPVGVIIQLTKTGNVLQNAAAINEALLISGLRQHELAAAATHLNVQLGKEIVERKLVEDALQAANQRLGNQAGELERLVIERTARLRETVGELEEFSYSVAHDLRAPLRGMQGFARLLVEKYSGRLDAEAQSYLERIASAAARMDSLIRDVLNYTQVLRGHATLAPIDLDRLVRDILSIYPDWQPPRVELVIEGTLPVVLGHPGFLTQCLSNLLSNAVKFVAPGLTPHVRIWAEERAPSTTQAGWSPENGEVTGGWASEGPVVRVWIEDNGVGIAEKDRERVFRMFERINSPEHFAGTGMGLTIVRKALERMGGRVDFQSAAGDGSKFWFELKKAPAGAKPSAAS
ncbi:MAG TPA: ATP-binding protein [Opitutaceae bacterium]|nr:ATP-binding protein [Opitutaceae bacterium]